MSTRRGKKVNPAKNFMVAKDFAEGKRIGRPKQVWVVDELPKTVKLYDGTQNIVRAGSGHWEKISEGQ